MVRIILVVLLCIHTAVTAFTLNDSSVWAVFPPFREDFVYQIFSDLVSSFRPRKKQFWIRLRSNAH